MKLFSRENVVGIFRGFSEGGLEFHADLVLPYRNEFQSTPMHGMFILVQLEHEEEAVIGRVTSICSQGRLSSAEGEDYGLRAIMEDRPIPEELREQYLKYRVDIRVLGVVRIVDGKLVFAASHRRLPHVGSKVAFLSTDLLREVAGHNLEGAEIGFLALGEFVYGGGDPRLKQEEWMVVKSPAVIPRFHVHQLVSRRSFVFARAGFGKSNLVKLLFSNLYRETPTVQKRGGRQVPVGSVIFDPDGEYFWPDDKSRPGLCDVPHLQDKLVIFTKRKGPSPFYDSFVASDIKLDIRRLRPADVLSIALSPEKQDQQNVRKLKMLNDVAWRELVDEIYRNKNAADESKLKRLLNLTDSQEAELNAARANMTTVVSMLHDPNSQMLDMLLYALKAGKLCVVDVSQVRGSQALVLSGLILHKIFEHNQQQFTEANPETIPTIAVVEEAQSVLGSTGDSSGEGPYVAWVKEGRKYDLGAVLITQQPGSIPNEILSQGDNWFIFHLLSSGDLQAVKRANAHFSDDILSVLLNEPIPGHGVFWSSSGGKPYPIPIRVLSFEEMYSVLDKDYRAPAANTFAQVMKREFSQMHERIREQGLSYVADDEAFAPDPEDSDEKSTDRNGAIIQHVIDAIHNDKNLIQRIRVHGIPWRGLQNEIARHLPEYMVDRDQVAYSLVRQVLNSLFGEKNWDTEHRESRSKSGSTTTWVVVNGD
jgi:hypothetical protein